MFVRLYRYFVLRPYWLALVIVVLLACWMLLKPTDETLTKQQQTTAAQVILKEENFPKVQIKRFIPQETTKSLTLYGKSEANSRAVIRAKVAGEIINVKTEKGRYVKANTHLANIEKSALPQQLAQAEGLLAERLLNYNAVKSLNDKGLQGRASLAEMNSLLLAAKTVVKQLHLQLQYTDIQAPFAGILQQQFAEKGDYLQVGDAIFSLENTDPIIIRGDTTEHYINDLKLGQRVSATLLSGEKISGNISYIAAYSDPQSSTFRIEAEFSNPDLKILSGISVKLAIPLFPVKAIYISPSTLAMDAQGNLGVKLVKDDRVVFKTINLVEADTEGVWLSGFSEPVDIITLGQGFVKPGDQVLAIVAEK